jgi:hypothetical protein
MTETSTVKNESVFHVSLYSVSPMILMLYRIPTTLLVAGIIFINWRNFVFVSRLLAVILLFDILFAPTLVRWAERRTGKKVESSVIVFNSYRQLMFMAMLLFPFHRDH